MTPAVEQHLPAGSLESLHVLSSAEIEALATKAARGAGLSWGLAEEMGFASRWLFERGFDAVAAAANRLRRTDGIAAADPRPAEIGAMWGVAGADRAACPIRLGTALVDHRWNVFPLALEDVAEPLLLLPFLASLAGTAGPLAVRMGRDRVRIGRSGLDEGASAIARCRTATLVVETCEPFDASPARLPQPFDSEALRDLEALAFRTAVPPSDLSRRGAGSSTADND